MVTYENNKIFGLQIAYIGGGSRNWARTLMSDLAKNQDLNGTVRLYDIDHEAAKINAVLGNRIPEDNPGVNGNFYYIATETLEEALAGADFVVISVLPGTFNEMASDVHTPEKYGIYQPVGDSTGLGGTIRALRTLPIFEEIAKGVEKCCPDAWVINYTNPMTVCTRMLYKTFPGIKAMGCCHEIFGVRDFFADMYCDVNNVPRGTVGRYDIDITVTGVNHFTWITKARYHNIDLLEMAKAYAKEKMAIPFDDAPLDVSGENWENMKTVMKRQHHFVKMDLLLRYGALAAAGDRHLAEFCPNHWYLGSPENVFNWGFGLTKVAYRAKQRRDRLELSQRLYSGEEKFTIEPTGEEGSHLIHALLGLGNFVTNVNIPNMGQIPDLPIGAVVETNAFVSTDSLLPVCAGPLPKDLKSLIEPIVACQEMIVEAVQKKDLSLAFKAFISDPQNNLSLADSKALFKEMCDNTKEYLTMYPEYQK